MKQYYVQKEEVSEGRGREGDNKKYETRLCTEGGSEGVRGEGEREIIGNIKPDYVQK